MSAQNYCMVNEATNVCDNVVLWDGNPNTWAPPAGYLMLVQATTPAKNWVWIDDSWVLEVSGEGQIGYTWDGTYLITNEPQPTEPPTIEGAQTL
jgi:hypothetical protein